MKILNLKTQKIENSSSRPSWFHHEVRIYSDGDTLFLNKKECVIMQNKQGKYNIVKKENGRKILPRFVDWIQYKEENLSYFFIQYKNGTYNIVNSQGKLLSKKWFYYIPLYGQWWWKGYFRVEIEKGEWNIINKEGDFVCKQNFLYIDRFVNHNTNYTSLSDEKNDIRKVFAIVTKKHKTYTPLKYSDPCDFDNIVNLEGTLLLKDWYSISQIDAEEFYAWKEHQMHSINIQTGKVVY